MNKSTISVNLTKAEIDDLIYGCMSASGEYCTSADERKPFHDLIDKLEEVLANDEKLADSNDE